MPPHSVSVKRSELTTAACERRRRVEPLEQRGHDSVRRGSSQRAHSATTLRTPSSRCELEETRDIASVLVGGRNRNVSRKEAQHSPPQMHSVLRTTRSAAPARKIRSCL